MTFALRDPSAFARYKAARPLPKPRASAENGPLVSALVDGSSATLPMLERCVSSLLAQSYASLEVCLCFSQDDAKLAERLGALAAGDARVRLQRRPGALTRGESLAGALAMARGDYVVFMRGDDELVPIAVAELVRAAHAARAKWAYSDSAWLGDDGTPFFPFFKPSWSPDRLMSQMYLDLQLIDAGLVRDVGGIRLGFEGSEEYDLALRLMEKAAPVRVPEPLYLRRAPRGEAPCPVRDETATRALRSALCRRGIAAGDPLDDDGSCSVTVTRAKLPGTFRVDYPIVGRPRVSIVIPFRDQWPVTKRCVESILALSTYPELEILLVDNASQQAETVRGVHELMARDDRVRGLEYPHPFNHSALNNFGAAHATGELLLMLNNDTEVITDDWLERMIGYAQRPDVGCVGPLLLYSNKRVQHAGVVLGIRGVAAHGLRGLPYDDPGYHGWPHVVLNVSAVTAACLMVRKELFERVGGMNERELPTSFNDVDLCLRVRELGLRNVFLGHTVLYHHESLSRGSDVGNTSAGATYMIAKWGEALTSDPYYSPNLTLNHEDFRYVGAD